MRLSVCLFFFFFSSRRRHTRFDCDWSSDVCSSDLIMRALQVHLVSGDSLTLLRRPTHDVEAYELYLKGRYFFNKGGFGPRSEERRVGKECRSRWSPYH